MSTRSLTEEDLEALEDQRDFLLRSLEDLEAERAAGDVDDNDYRTLREGYTARAAQVIRTMEAHRAQTTEAPSRPWWRRYAVVAAGALAFIGLAGGLVVQTARQRLADDTLTGDIRTTPDGEVERAIGLASQGAVDDALTILDGILAEQPDHVKAATYKGWFQVLSGDLAGGAVTLTSAAQMDPDYPDAHAFLVVTFFRLGNAPNATPEQADYFHDLARRELGVLDDLTEGTDALGEMSALLEPIRTELEAPPS